MDFGIAERGGHHGDLLSDRPGGQGVRVDNKWIPIACGVRRTAGHCLQPWRCRIFRLRSRLWLGIVSGFAATGVNQAAKQLSK